MSSMWSVDSGAGQPQRPAPQGVCEPAPVCYPRKRREDWPFRFYEEGGRMYENYAPRRARKPDLDGVEEALW